MGRKDKKSTPIPSLNPTPTPTPTTTTKSRKDKKITPTPTPIPVPAPAPVPTPIVRPPPPPPAPESDSDSDSDSDSETAIPATASDEDTQNENENDVVSSSSSEQVKPPSPPLPPKPKHSKRPAQPETSPENPPKKPKPTSPPTAIPMTPQKGLFQRVWSDEDELVILRGMVEYKERNSVDPMSNADDFIDVIKDKLHLPDANKGQIVSKVRRLKKRFVTAGNKKKLTDPHEVEVFELSKKVWGDLKQMTVEESKSGNSGKVRVVGNGEVTVGKKGVEVDVEVRRDMDVEFGFSREDGVVLRDGMRRMGDEERKEVREMVEKANVAYLDAYLLRLKVMEVVANKMLDDIRNDKC